MAKIEDIKSNLESTEGSGTSPGVYLRDDPIFGAQLINQSELRAPTAEKAAYLLDAALAARSRGNVSFRVIFKEIF
ncbi:UNVERIFIED_CONTAM: Kinesin-like protein KIF26A [Trichonephila clavipes]